MRTNRSSQTAEEQRQLAKDVGKRLLYFRNAMQLTQEKVAERANLHMTYIGQVERGEKNITIDSLRKILRALGVSLAEFFTVFDEDHTETESPSHQCYELIISRSAREQEALRDIVYGVISFADGKDR